MRLMSETLTSVWGPLSEPIHTEPLPEGRPAFRDNAYLGFWDRGGEVVGAFHVSTSPNAEGRRAALSPAAGGRGAAGVRPPPARPVPPASRGVGPERPGRGGRPGRAGTAGGGP